MWGHCVQRSHLLCLGDLRQMKNKLWLGFSMGNSYSLWNARIICKMGGGLYGKHCDNVWAPLHGALQIIQ